jgi:ectoine hydroxylase-related dioxygenase (phytanoyl-CoA dioxygenase family)
MASSNTPKTSFKLFDKSEIEIEMNEGEILIFPSYLEHISKSNKSDKIKTIISFNIN